MSKNWEYESELALKAVSIGGEIARERPEKFKVTTKESLRDVVTEVDLRIQEKIKDLLSPSQIPMIGEEGFNEDSVLPKNQPFWAVDPIDGTANYVNGIPYFGVSVGLCQGDEFVVGAVSLPALKELYFTYGKRGAFINGKTLHVHDAPLSKSLVAVGFAGSSNNQDYRARQYEYFGIVNDTSRGAMRLGSAAANICYVASGRLQAAVGIDSRIWDVAGALAVAIQAGAHLSITPGTSPSRVHYIVGGKTVVHELKEMALKKEVMPR